MAIKKPAFNEPCNGCGYCCSVEPCQLAREFLHCQVGPCVALEIIDGRSQCGLVTNPLGYLYQAAHPDQPRPVMQSDAASEHGQELSRQIAQALGVGKGCDAEDSEAAAVWTLKCSQHKSITKNDNESISFVINQKIILRE